MSNYYKVYKQASFILLTTQLWHVNFFWLNFFCLVGDLCSHASIEVAPIINQAWKFAALTRTCFGSALSPKSETLRMPNESNNRFSG